MLYNGLEWDKRVLTSLDHERQLYNTFIPPSHELKPIHTKRVYARLRLWTDGNALSVNGPLPVVYFVCRSLGELRRRACNIACCHCKYGSARMLLWLLFL